MKLSCLHFIEACVCVVLLYFIIDDEFARTIPYSVFVLFPV